MSSRFPFLSLLDGGCILIWWDFCVPTAKQAPLSVSRWQSSAYLAIQCIQAPSLDVSIFHGGGSFSWHVSQRWPKADSLSVSFLMGKFSGNLGPSRFLFLPLSWRRGTIYLTRFSWWICLADSLSVSVEHDVHAPETLYGCLIPSQFLFISLSLMGWTCLPSYFSCTARAQQIHLLFLSLMPVAYLPGETFWALGTK